MSDPFIGEIMLCGFNFAPVDYAQCNGQSMSVSQHNALVALIGFQFGGNGQTEFNLPDLRGRVPMHVGHGVSMANFGGMETVTLTAANIGHRHEVIASTNEAQEGLPFNFGGGDGYFLATNQNAVQSLYSPASSSTVSLADDALSSVGGGMAHNNMQPSIAINFCIAIEGTFPSRN